MFLRVLTRLSAGLAVILGIVVLTFVLLHIAPGDPARQLAGPAASAQQIAALNQQLGLDRPLHEQFVIWISRAVRGDWGVSLTTGRPVGEMLRRAWPWTALLVASSLLLSYAIGIGVALWQAVSRRRLDTGLSIVSVTLAAMPAYWLGIILVWVFTYELNALPAFGAAGLDADFLSPGAQLADHVRHLLLPVTTLTLIGVGGAARFARGALMDTRHALFLLAARARGLPAWRVLVRHLLLNALGPVVTLLGLSLPALFSGAVFVEGIFAWPGVGRVLIDAVAGRDYPVVMAAATVSAILVVIGNLLADLLHAAVDPRLLDV